MRRPTGAFVRPTDALERTDGALRRIVSTISSPMTTHWHASVKAGRRAGWLPLVAPEDAEIAAVHRNHAVARVKLAHSDQAEVGQVWTSIGVFRRELRERGEIRGDLEGERREVQRVVRRTRGAGAKSRAVSCATSVRMVTAVQVER